MHRSKNAYETPTYTGRVTFVLCSMREVTPFFQRLLFTIRNKEYVYQIAILMYSVPEFSMSITWYSIPLFSIFDGGGNYCEF